jgi:hypothetical protein
MNKTFALFWTIALLTAAGCSTEVEAPAANQHASPEAVAKSLNSVDPSKFEYLFEYDPTLPLDIQDEQSSQGSGWAQIDFSYASPKGGRVPARMVLPEGEEPFPGLLLQHGSLRIYDDFTPAARVLARYGTVVLMINDPYSRPGGW